MSVIKALDDLIKPEQGIVGRKIFVDQEIYQVELERIFAPSWSYLGHDSNLKEPGDYFTMYMTEDPVMVTRDQDGKIRAFLNSCRHRGMRVCRSDFGNTSFFRCPYHGWTYRNDGKLIGVPGYETGYFGELDKEKWGLVEVANLVNYKGMIWATWNKDAPSFENYLGGMKPYLDLMLDRQGGVEVLGGVQKWVVNCNWKFPSENAIGDDYHLPITHGAVFALGLRKHYTDGRGIYVGNGHGFSGGYGAGEGPKIKAAHTNPLKQARTRLMKEKGQYVEKLIPLGHGLIFPNFAFSDNFSYLTFRVRIPQGPHRTMIYAWCVVEKNLTEEAKMDRRKQYILQFGPGGLLEQDDYEVMSGIQSSSKGKIASDLPYNYQMGLGHEQEASEVLGADLPGKITGLWSEANQRGFYKHWLELMTS